MAIIKKIGDDYYLCKRKIGLYRGSHNIQEKYTPIFKVKSGWYKTQCIIQVGYRNVYLPKELFGKKIMLKVVVIEDKKEEFKFEDLEEIYA